MRVWVGAGVAVCAVDCWGRAGIGGHRYPGFRSVQVPRFLFRQSSQWHGSIHNDLVHRPGACVGLAVKVER